MSTIDQVAPKTKSNKSSKAKKDLNDFVGIIEKELELYFKKELSKVFGVSSGQLELARNIWEHIKEHDLRPAKRLRGSFVYYGYKLLHGKDLVSALKAAMSIELVHTALLMHDDFMDQDNTRRGLPTTHEHYKSYHTLNKYRFDPQHYGESMAVTIGDIALLAGHEILSRSNFEDNKKIEALNRLLRGIINTGLGQAYDVTLEAKGTAKEEDIINLHHAKTAIYTYENPLHIGAILAGASKNDLDILTKYAVPGGIAFQLQDDILGLFGNIEKTGKPAHSDLRQGKMTLLIIEALKRGTPQQIKRLNEIWGNRDLTESEANEVRKIVKDTGSLKHSFEISVRYAQKAQGAIPEMIKKGWNKEAVDYLDGIAQYMVERDV